MEPVVYRRLSELVNRYQIDKHHKPEKYVRDLFEALDWGNKPTFSIEKDEGFGYQLAIDRCPVINVLTRAPTEIENVYKALNRAYNQDVEWVVATNFNSLGLYGSYWASFRYNVDSALAFQIKFADYPLEVQRLELLTPQEVSHNTVRELYSAFPGRKRRIPIDIHLVDRMSGWRNLALNALRSGAPEQDPLIHRLINTLFLIRYVEDTGKGPTNDRLAALAANLDNASFMSALYSRFEEIRRRTAYNVPTAQEFRRLEDTPLRQLIHELYGYPELGIEYDFGAMTVDVLGRFYEEYLRLDVLPPAAEPATPKLTLFESESYEFQDIRKKRGVYYTPRYIVDYILKNLIERFRGTQPSGKPPCILDIATGSGTFLTAALDWLHVFFPDQATVDLVENIIGIDIDERAIEAARLSLTAKLLSDHVTRRPPHLKLYKLDFIRHRPNNVNPVKELPTNGVDVVVGNPPYINYEGLKRRYGVTELSAIAAHFETTEGRFDSYILFTEASMKVLRQGGLAGLVLSNRILSARAGAPLRKWLAERADILEVVDFLHQPVFQGVGSYVCLLLFRKRSPDTTSPQVTIGRLHSLSEAPSSQLARISVASGDMSGGLESFRVDQPSGPGPWVFRNKKELEIAETIEKVSDNCLGDVVDIRQGVKTGADGIFVFDGVRPDGGFLNVPKTAEKIEADLLVPVFRNRDLKRWGTRPKSFLLYPYDRAKQKLLPWPVLEKQFPRAANYLAMHKN
jgi:tRNA1(Val) A37 N6-methylase TrmN6